MFKSVRLVVSLPTRVARLVIEDATDPATRGCELFETLDTGDRWAVGQSARPGLAPVAVVLVVPELSARAMVRGGPRRRRDILRALARQDRALFVSAAPAPVDAPPVEVVGVPFTAFWRAQNAALDLAHEWDNARVRLVEPHPREVAV